MQGSYGTGKSHLANAIAKAVNTKWNTLAYMSNGRTRRYAFKRVQRKENNRKTGTS
ncbi:hypothetical protein I5B93_04170 [Staphylococcus aureus]|nr:hypothetical protein I5B93_04170 [Staphylococcus aureus]